MLVMDFEYAVSVVNAGLDKRYEWVASLSLLITILWIYESPTYFNYSFR